MKKTSIILLLAAVSLFGCSYKEIEDGIRSEMHDEVIEHEVDNVTTASENTNIHISEDSNAVLPEKVSSEMYAYVPVGKRFKGWIEITDPSIFFYPAIGDKGLNYAVAKVSVYDTLAETQVSLEDIREDSAQGAIDFYGEDVLSFIIIEMTAKYDNPTDDEELNSITPEFRPSVLSRRTDDFEECPKQIIQNPSIFYFSEHLKNEDNAENPYSNTYLMENYYRFNEPLKSGQEISFCIGVVVDEWFVKTKNLFIAMSDTHQPYYKHPIEFVDILERFDDYEAFEK